MEQELERVTAPMLEGASTEPLPPWVVLGGEFYGHRDWRIDEIVGLWIKVVEAKSKAATPSEAWIYLPTGIVYGGTTLQRRSAHGLPTVSR